jgi:hypothetical protein
MKKLSVVMLLFAGIVFILFSCKDYGNKPSANRDTPGKPVIEILYMNHGPLQPVLAELRKVLGQFENDIIVEWHDFDLDQEFKVKKQIDVHVPLAIWINNESSITINSSKIRLTGFPKNHGPVFAQGTWSMEDLKKGVDTAVKESKK